MLVTTSDEVRSLFSSAPRGRAAFEQWQRRRRLQSAGVIQTVLHHHTTALYTLTPDDLEKTFRENEHPLGHIDQRTINRVAKAKNWWPAYAFTHLLNFLLERNRRLPTWQEFHSFFTETNEGKVMLGDEARDKLEEIKADGVPHNIAKDALTWRVGNAYYGLARDIYTLVHLRALGVDARAHPLADALFRTDCWIGRNILSVRVRNPEFASGRAGRKTSPENLLSNASPRFNFYTIELEAADEYGTAHLPTIDSIASCARRLSAMQ
jgi:hypothetical protein